MFHLLVVEYIYELNLMLVFLWIVNNTEIGYNEFILRSSTKMKYYKNLIKNKNYVGIIFGLVLAFFGAIVFYANFIEVIFEGVKDSNLSVVTVVNTEMVGLIGETNIGLKVIGILTIYVGIVCIPRWCPGSQNDEDYVIENIGENQIYIKYKKNEFLVKKDFEPTDLFFKDKNRKFVSLTRGYQIYNYFLDYQKKERFGAKNKNN